MDLGFQCFVIKKNLHRFEVLKSNLLTIWNGVRQVWGHRPLTAIVSAPHTESTFNVEMAYVQSHWMLGSC